MRTSPSWWTGPSRWPRRARGPAARPTTQVADLLRAYYRHVAVEDLADRSDVDVYGAFASHYKLAANRPQGTATGAGAHADAERPGLGGRRAHRGRGRRRRHAVPRRLADHGAVPPAARRARRHPPQLRRGARHHRRAAVDRAGAGRRPRARGRGRARVVDARRDRPAARGRRPARRSSRTSSGCSATSARRSRTGARCTPRSRTIVTGLAQRPAAARPRGGPPGAPSCSSGWPTSTSPSSATRSTSSSSATTTSSSSPSPGTGLGILRADQEMSESFGRLPEAVKAKAREKTLLVLAKANSRATVHRPAYLDYVGVKTFDANGEVDGERRFLGLFSSAAYTESLMRIPLIREKAAAVLKRSGFDPRSHAGKALMDTLETYPRDELFHTPIDELAPMAEAAMAARRAARGADVHPPRHLRPLRLGDRLPAARPLQHRRSASASQRILQERLQRRVHRVHGADQRVHDRARALRRAPAQGRRDPRRRHRRPRAPADRGVPVLARRLHRPR